MSNEETRNMNIMCSLRETERAFCFQELDRQEYDKFVLDQFFENHLEPILSNEIISPCRDLNRLILNLKERCNWRVERVFYNGSIVRYENKEDRTSVELRIRRRADGKGIELGSLEYNGNRIIPRIELNGRVETICNYLDAFCRDDLPAFKREADVFFEKMMRQHRSMEILLTSSKQVLSQALKDSGFAENEYMFRIENNNVILRVCGRRYSISIHEKNLPRKLETLSQLLIEFGESIKVLTPKHCRTT